MKCKRLGASVSKLVASPTYLKRSSAPRAPLDLKEHAFLRCTAMPGRQEVIELRNGRRRVRVPVQGKFAANHLTAVRHYALQGERIALLPLTMSTQELEQGQLVPVLPEWSTEGTPIHLLYVDQRFLPAKIEAFVQYAGRYPWPTAWCVEPRLQTAD